MATTDQRNRRKGSRGPTARDTAVSRSRSLLFGSDPAGGDGSGGSVSDDRVSDDRVSDDTVSADSLSEAISLLESFVGAFEPGRYSGEDAAVLVERFSLGERLCATGKALAAKRATETEHHRKDGSRSAAEWLAGKTGESLGHAAGSLQLANQMEDHPGLGDALRSGELSQTRAHTVAGVLKLDPDSEDELLKAAKDRTETNRQLADRCLRAKARARSAEDNRAAHERIRAARFLRHYTDGDGAFRLEGSFTPDAGARLLAALKPTRTVLFDEARRQGLREHPDAYGADALVALVTGERQRRPRAPRGDEETTGQRTGGRADTDQGSLHGDEGTDMSGNSADFADSAHPTPPTPTPATPRPMATRTPPGGPRPPFPRRPACTSGWTLPPCAGDTSKTPSVARSPALVPSPSRRPESCWATPSWSSSSPRAQTSPRSPTWAEPFGPPSGER